MRVEELDFDLPAERVAQEPAARRDGSRLMLLRGAREPGVATGVSHHRFVELPELLRADDLLVVNDTQVLAARIDARRATGGRVELLFTEPVGDGSSWRVLARPARRLRAGDALELADEPIVRLKIESVEADGARVVRLPAGVDAMDLMARLGRMPVPPYVGREAFDERAELDRTRYQTVYAERPGAIAAPTAGLHFSAATFARLESVGVEVARITLHVGAGTFRPVSSERVEDHTMTAERFEVSEAAAARIVDARRAGRRVVAVGTTVVRTLEGLAATRGGVRAARGSVDLFITPGYRFQVVGGMITNFHLPRSTPILLVAALVGLEPLLDAYRTAIERGYRFYSYGDAMLVIP